MIAIDLIPWEIPRTKLNKLLISITYEVSISINCCYCFVNCSFIYLGFPTELTRKHVSDMFMQRELEFEARKPGANRLTTWKFFLDNDDEKFIEEVLERGTIFTILSYTV